MSKVEIPNFVPEYLISTLSQRMDWGIVRNKLPNTWKITKGKGIKAMVIDTGHPNHKDIGQNAKKGLNCVKGENINDYNGHQTHCVGIICAKDNNRGMVGVAPESTTISVKALDSNGGGEMKYVYRALEYAKKIRPDIISMSLGSPKGTNKLHKLIRELYEMGIPIICAAGNDGERGVDYPAKYPETIAIAAYDKHGSIANFSAIGPQVDWAAPGVKIYSTFINNTYAVLNGTSMATPFITGVICLLLAKHRDQERSTGKNDCKTVEQIRKHLMKYTVDKGYVGKDNKFGYGVLDVEKLITSSDSDSDVTPELEFPRKNWFTRFRSWLNQFK